MYNKSLGDFSPRLYLAEVQGRRISGGYPLCADRSEAKNEPCASQVRCHASRQTPACASTAGAFLKERANDGVRGHNLMPL